MVQDKLRGKIFPLTTSGKEDLSAAVEMTVAGLEFYVSVKLFENVALCGITGAWSLTTSSQATSFRSAVSYLVPWQI
ncbi:hypothetical protein EYC59_06435 [Candidatus Saccharibacteria bacterium]|nr:MAG: hypothetical protein EYC59_06435 [Candidatus Saccharibacteria bacterium]